MTETEPKNATAEQVTRRASPRVSVLLPAYNADRFVDAAVESLRVQTFSDWEIVAVDDCSRDGTDARLLAWAEREPRLRCLRNSRNQGLTRHWNEAPAPPGGGVGLEAG